jgi:hypothetical protein
MGKSVGLVMSAEKREGPAIETVSSIRNAHERPKDQTANTGKNQSGEVTFCLQKQQGTSTRLRSM